MRRKILTSLLFLHSFAIFAQKDLPAFGKIDKADLLLKECEFDKDAEAYKLLDYGDVTYVRGRNYFKIQMEIRVRIKVLKDKGLDNANIKINYYSKSNYEDITEITGITYNLDDAGNTVITKLNKDAIYKKPINNRISEVSFTMPDVKAGSVFEYKYIDTKESISNLDDWNFQGDIPTRLSVYKITIPTIFRFVNQLMVYQKVEQLTSDVSERTSSSEGVMTYNSVKRTYILRNVPAIKEEPYMSSTKDYMERVVFQLSQIVYGDGIEEIGSSWPKLTQELLENEDFGIQLRKNIPHTKGLDDSLKLVKDDLSKMKLIHNYVRRNMNWNGGESIYTSNGIKSAWDKKSGSNAEINMILINLLRDAGLKAYPMLVSTKDNGVVNTVYPFLQQFNNTMACVFIGDKKYYINAADKYNPCTLIPYDVINNEAFIVDLTYGGWTTLTDDKQIFKNVVSLMAEINDEGKMSGNASVACFGYSKNPRVKTWKEDNSSFKEYFSKSFTGMDIEKVDVSNIDDDTLPLMQKVKFSLPLSASGEYKYFTLNLFQDLETNPFISDKRQTDVDFGYNQSYMVVGKIFLPDNYELEELPKDIKMIMEDTSIIFKRIIQVSDNSIDFRVNVDFVKPQYPVGVYPDFKEFYKKLFAALNEQIVLKKKKTA